MAISAQVNLTFSLESESYTVNLDIPSSTPTADAPFNFNVVNNPAKDSKEQPIDLLSVAVGATNQVYVAVSPPKNLLDAAVSGLVQNLEVVVKEGTYDPTTNKFTA